MDHYKSGRQYAGGVSAVEEEVGVIKSGVVFAGFAPLKSKKTYYAVLRERALELHDSEKSQKKKKHARHLVDLSTSFNIARHHDTRLKYCVSVMTPDETLLIRGENDTVSDEWYEMLMSAIIPARALRLGRPVLSSEFFECAWDVTLVENPKLKKPIRNAEEMPNMCKKDASLAGPHRLCFYPHTIILCKRGIEPAAITELPQSGIPPFRQADFVEFPRKFVASFGCQEKFFIMRMGRSSPSGLSEMWAQCENDEIAADIHNKLNKIIERESEKKKQIGNGSLLRGSATSTPHTERQHSVSSRQRISSLGTTSELSIKERRAQLRDSKAAVDSFEERNELRPIAPLGWFSVFDSPLERLRTGSPGSFSGASNLELFRRKCSSTATTSCGSPLLWGCPGVSTQPTRAHSICGQVCSPPPPATAALAIPRKKSGTIREELPVGNFHGIDICRQMSSFISPSPAEETEDSGGTLRVVDNDDLSSSPKTICDREIAATIEKMLPMELRERCGRILGDDALYFDSEGLGHSESEHEHPYGGSLSGACSSSTNDDSNAHRDVSEDTSGDNLEYAPMEMNSWSSGSASHLAVPIPFEQQYNLDEVQSYVSDSSDSCYSSLAPNGAPRAYSFGSHVSQHKHHASRRYQPEEGSPLPDSNSSSTQNGVHQRGVDILNTLNVTQEDPRKRAFSLGSKSWFQKPFRKFSRDLTSRAHRHSNASNVSLCKAAATPGVTHYGHTPASLQAYIAPDPLPCARVRSESIGSGCSTPYTRRSVASAVPGDHVQFDFGNVAPLGRSASGSVHSTDSPLSRSRTSSIGGSQRHSQCVRDPGDIVVHTVDETECERSPRLLVSLAHDNPQSVGQSEAVHDDYISRDPGDNDYVLGDASACVRGQSNIINFADSHSSQIFETIQESASTRSSRASSRSSSREVERLGMRIVDDTLKEEDDGFCSEEKHTTASDGNLASRKNSESWKEDVEVQSRSALLAPPETMPKRSSVPSLRLTTSQELPAITRDDSDLKYVLVDVARPAEAPRRSRSKSSSVAARGRSVDYVRLLSPHAH